MPLHALVNDLTRMEDVEQHHHAEHERSIKNVQEDLVPQEVPVLSHDILDDPEHGTDHDEQAREVEDPEVPLPRDGEGLGFLGWVARDAVVEDCGRDDEDAEADDLDA